MVRRQCAVVDHKQNSTSSRVEDADGTLLAIARPTSSRQPSPGFYTSEGSPSMGSLSATLGESSTMSRRPRPAGLRNSYDRWGESYESWEKSQKDVQGEEDITPRTETDSSQNRRTGLRSVVNEGLRAAGLTRASTTASSIRRGREDPLPRSQTTGSLANRTDSLVTSPTSLDPSSALTRLSSERERSRSRADERSVTDIDSLRERSSNSRHTFFSPNVLATRTIHNVLSTKASESPNKSPEQLTPMDGRETPANLRLFKSNYSSTPMGKAFTSPSGTQRHLPTRSGASNAGMDSPRQIGNGLNTNNTSSGSLSPAAKTVQLLNDALYMFESHVQRLPQASSMPDTYSDVVRDAKGIVNAAAALNMALRSAAAVCVDEQVDAEVQAQSETTTEGHALQADVWRKVAAEFREDVRVSDELVRALTSFMIGTGRMLRSANPASHSRMQSAGDASSAVGSVSRASGTALARGGSVRGAGSSDGRRSVEGWTRNIGMATGDRRSVDGRPSHDGRRSVDPTPHGVRRSAEEHREDTMRRMTARQAALDQLEGGSNGSGGGSSGPRHGSHRVSYNDSRSQTSLSMIRDIPRFSHEALSSPGPRTFTSLSSRRSTGAPTPAMTQKALPNLPMPPAGGELSFPQMDDGGDRTPIELPRAHLRHSTMPALAVPPPLPTLPSESLMQRNRTISKHGASNSITSASTTSTTRPKAVTRSTMILSSPSADLSTPTLASAGERSRRTSVSSATSPFSMGRSRGSALLNGMNQATITAQSRNRTISITNDDDFAAPKENHPTLTSSADVPSSHSRATGGWSSANASPTIGPRGASGRPLLNRRTSSTLSGAPVTSPGSGLSSPPSAAKSRVISRMSSAGTLDNAPQNTNSRPNLISAEAYHGTDSGQDEERRLRRSRVRVSVLTDKRPGVADLLIGRRTGTGRPRDDAGDHRESPDVSPSLGARERRERRQAEAL